MLVSGDSANGASPAHGDVDYSDYAHTGPGTLAGRYLRRFWQPVALGRDLAAGTARPIRILSEDYTLYRGEDGTPHLIAPRCAHRGTQLSTGWVEGACIRCFYHGWKYDASGQCVEQPAEDASFAAKVRIASYPTEEYLGLIFAYLGEGEAPPLPRFTELEADGLLEWSTYLRLCNYSNNIENNLDQVHIAFVHRRSVFTGVGLTDDLPTLEVVETDYGIEQRTSRPGKGVRKTHILMPNAVYFAGTPRTAESGWRETLTWRVPRDDVSHYAFNVSHVGVTGAAAARYRAETARQDAELAALPPADEIAAAVLRGELRIQDVPERPDLVIIQDYVAQVGQGAIPDRPRERLGRSDVALILYRQMWARELRALAAGQPLKRWTRPASLLPAGGA
jgi:5,5'-dehydrodivanillate O-demethylase oxygenase subunit